MSTPSTSGATPLPRRVRQAFVSDLEGCLDSLSTALVQRLVELVDKSASTREAQERRDATLEFERHREAWVANTRAAWRRGIDGQEVQPVAEGPSAGEFALIDDDVVEKKIIASRLAMAIQERATWEWNDLKLRMQHLQDGLPLLPDDVLRPEGLSMMLVEQWMASDLPRRTWLLVNDVIQQHVVPVAAEGYKRLNQMLVAEGVLPQIDLSGRVRRSQGPASRSGGNEAVVGADVPNGVTSATGRLDGGGGGLEA